MAVLSNNNLTLADWAKRRDPDGSAAVIANILSQSNEILDDAVFVEANGATSHRVTIATGLPDVYWRSFNEGVVSSKGTTAQVDEGIGMLESRSEVDVALADLQNDAAAFRLGEARLRLEAMNQKMAETLFYGNTATEAASFMGLANRYNSLSAGNAQNVLTGGGTTAASQASIWLVGWGDECVFATFPKGSNAGLTQEDLGKETVNDWNGVAGASMRAYVDWFKWHSGLVVRDWRYAVRVPNIEVADLTDFTAKQTIAQTGTDAFQNIMHKMAESVYRIPNLGMCKPAFYMNRTLHSGLARMAMEKSYAALAIEEGLSQFGTARRFLSFMGIPIRRVDKLLNTEAVIS
jgi:hypothetical protein